MVNSAHLEELEQGGFMVKKRLTAVLFVQTTHGDHGLMAQLIIQGKVEEPLPPSYRILLMDSIVDLPILQTLTKKATKYQLPVDLTVQVTR
jgi:hypothetical protein